MFEGKHGTDPGLASASPAAWEVWEVTAISEDTQIIRRNCLSLADTLKVNIAL